MQLGSLGDHDLSLDPDARITLPPAAPVRSPAAEAVLSAMLTALHAGLSPQVLAYICSIHDHAIPAQAPLPSPELHDIGRLPLIVSCECSKRPSQHTIRGQRLLPLMIAILFGLACSNKQC